MSAARPPPVGGAEWDRASPLLLAPATISSYSILCLSVSSTDLAGRFLRDTVSQAVVTLLPV